MALLKNITHENGKTIGYWELNNVSISLKTGGAIVVLYGFENKAACDAGLAPMMEKQVSFATIPTNFPTNFKTLLHTRILEQEGWTDAQVTA